MHTSLTHSSTLIISVYLTYQTRDLTLGMYRFNHVPLTHKYTILSEINGIYGDIMQIKKHLGL